jgi:hypothetical protein
MTNTSSRQSPLHRCAALVLLALLSSLLVVPSGTAAAAGTILRSHPHEGTGGTLPTAAAEGYDARAGQAVSYVTSPTAADGNTSLRFSGTAATYLEDSTAVSGTGQLVWSAPVLLPALPTTSSRRFLAARTATAGLASVDVAATGRVLIRDGAATVRATGTLGLATGTWYRIEVLTGSARTTVRVFDLAGTLLDTVGPAATSVGTPTRLRAGALTIGPAVLIDRVQIADDWITDVPLSPPPYLPCGALASSYSSAALPQYEHVVVLMEENWSYAGLMASTEAPFLYQLNANCGSETNFHAATHPSQPNYMAATSGTASGVGVKTSADNVFQQVQAAGRTWKGYAESMSTPCQGSSTATYKPGHNPAVFYTDLRQPANTCLANDVPLEGTLALDIANDSLPAYSWITPNECHIFYWVTSCSTPRSQLTRVGDAWLADLLPRLTATPSYQAGKTLILITYDEGGIGTSGVDCTDPAYYPAHPDCQVPTVVVSPYLTRGTTDGTDLNLYSLLATTQDVLGLPRLGRAVGQASMRTTMPF